MTSAKEAGKLYDPLVSVLNSAPATKDFFLHHASDITRYVTVQKRNYHEVSLPWVCFEGESKEEMVTNAVIFQELVSATHIDHRRLVLEIGPATSVGPWETSIFFSAATVIGLDCLDMPYDGYTTNILKPVIISKRQSFVASFQLHTSYVKSFSPINADRVQLVGFPNSSLPDNITKSSVMVAIGGDLLVVCETDVQKQYPLREEVVRWLPGFTVSVSSMSLQNIRDTFGFSHSMYLQTFGLQDPTLLSVIYAKRTQ
jgi:hypothetical protein